jgi:4a-hydroxytetrahydrobiopterin dehydratase
MLKLTPISSNPLAEESCEPCNTGCRPLSKKEALSLIPSVPGWTMAEREGVARLEREFSFHDFTGPLAFANRIGEMANREDHHPSLLLEWGSIKASWWTHRVKGLHRNDFICAAKTSALFED